MAIKWGTPPLQMLAFRCLADHRKPLFIHKKTKTNHVHNLCYLYMSPPQKKKKIINVQKIIILLFPL